MAAQTVDSIVLFFVRFYRFYKEKKEKSFLFFLLLLVFLPSCTYYCFDLAFLNQLFGILSDATTVFLFSKSISQQFFYSFNLRVIFQRMNTVFWEQNIETRLSMKIIIKTDNNKQKAHTEIIFILIE